MSIEKENFSNPLEEEKNPDIENATSFDALYEVIRSMGEIKGTRRSYTPEQLIKKIEQVRHGHRPINFVTRSHGIRNAVERLLENDRIYQKYIKRSEAKSKNI